MVEPLQAGTQLGEYRIEAVIARGGMATVYRATHERLERRVALKVIVPELARDPAFRRRFERESRLAASIEHPHAVPVYEAGEVEDVLYIAMRYIEGTDLRALLASESWLEPGRAARLTSQIAGALDEAHSHGLVHRDVKPANVLLGDVGGQEWAYLTDFGLAKPVAAGSDLTGSGEWMGTLDYVSPEQIQGGAVDARSDVYSLGCVLFEQVTGRIPYEREEEVAKLWAHVHEPPPRLAEQVPDAPAELDRVVARAMAKAPADRYPSAGDLARATTAAVEGSAVAEPERSVATGEAAPGPAATRVIGAGRGGGSVRSRPWLLVAVVIGAVALAAVAALLLKGGEPTVAGTIHVGGRPLGIAFGEGSIWVTNEQGDELTRIDPDTGEVSGDPIRVGKRPTGVRTGEGSVWVANSAADTISRINPKTRQVVADIRVGDQPAGIKVDEGFVWVSNVQDGTVVRIKARGDELVGQPIRVGRSPAQIAIGEGSTWVAVAGEGDVARIDPSGDLVGRPISVGARPRGITVGEGKVWVTNALDDSVSRIDPLSGDVEGEPTRVGDRPAGVAVGAGYVWVANTSSNTVSRIDPGSGEVVGDPIEVGERPRGIAIGNGSIWVANYGDGTVTRIEP